MRVGLEYAPRDVPFPFKGFNKLIPPDLLAPSYSPNCSNVMIEDGIVQTRPGFKALGTGIVATEDVLTIIPFETTAGALILIAVTTEDIYKLSGTTWTSILGSELWTATVDSVISWSQGLDGDTLGRQLWITNGGDEVLMWTGTGNVTSPTLLPAGHAVKVESAGCLRVWKNRLILGNIQYSDASDGPQNLMWSDALDLDDFANGTAGELTLAEASGRIRWLEEFGDQLAVYTDNSIAFLSNIGGDFVMSTSVVAQQTNLASPKSVVALPGVHLYLTRENFMAFDGTPNLVEIGPTIAPWYRSLNASVNPVNAFGAYLSSRSRVFWILPGGIDLTGTGYGHTVYVMDFENNNLGSLVWSPFVFEKVPICATPWILPDDLGVGSLEGEQEMIFGFEDGLAARFSHALTPGAGTDAGSAFVSGWDTPDFVVGPGYPGALARWGELRLRLSGTGPVLVRYSLNRGSTWTSLDASLDITGTPTTYRLPFDKISEQVRFRLQSAGTQGFFLYFLQVWYKPQGAR